MAQATTDLAQVAVTVRRLRAERGLRQYQLAEVADVGVRTLATVELAEAPVSETTYGRLAKALDVSLAELLGEEN